MRTHEQGPVFVDRLVVGVDELEKYFAVAPELPRKTTMGAVTSYVAGADEPVLFVYTACRSQNEEDIEIARAATSAVAAASSAGPDVADGLADAIRRAPTRSCRIDFQHTGGALADTGDTATAFWGRGTLGVLAADSIGGYSVEVRPGFSETEKEVQLAFGENLSRLRSLRQPVDAAGVLGSYPL